MKILKSLFVIVSMCLCIATLTVSTIAAENETKEINYEKVTDVTNLKKGDKVIFGAPSKNFCSTTVVSDIPNTYLKTEKCVFTENDSKLTTNVTYLEVYTISEYTDQVTLRVSGTDKFLVYSEDGKQISLDKTPTPFVLKDSIVYSKKDDFGNLNYSIQVQEREDNYRYSQFKIYFKEKATATYLYREVKENPINDIKMISRLAVNYDIQKVENKNDIYTINQINGKNDLSLQFGFQMSSEFVENQLSDVEYGVFYASMTTLTNSKVSSLAELVKSLKYDDTQLAQNDIRKVSFVKETTTAQNTLAKVDVSGNEYAGSGEYFYQCGVSITGVPTANINTEVVAVAYIQVNGEYFFSTQRVESVSSLCEKYLSTTDYADFEGILKYLKDLK